MARCTTCWHRGKGTAPLTPPRAPPAWPWLYRLPHHLSPRASGQDSARRAAAGDPAPSTPRLLRGSGGLRDPERGSGGGRLTAEPAASRTDPHRRRHPLSADGRVDRPAEPEKARGRRRAGNREPGAPPPT